MIDGLPAVVGLASPFAAALALFYLVFTGRLIVRSEHKEMVRILETRNVELAVERDTWRTSSEKKDETVRILSNSNSSLMETAQFATKVMSAIQLRNSGENNVPT